ncbi:MAG: HNH endonuclease [Gemmataceae bacterium]
MDFQALQDFIQNKMRMSHIYQPVMLITLLEHGGKASVRDIASSICSHDESQLEYYELITKNMVGKVLRNRNIVVKEKDAFGLPGFKNLSNDQILELKNLLIKKLEEFKSKRGDRVWHHRQISSGYIPSSVKYEVLKRARLRCELCGVSQKDKALEVDHIIPRNKGGSDDPSNFQSLCYSCNAMKRDTDDTDFRAIAESYNHRHVGCSFCTGIDKRVCAENELCFGIEDQNSSILGHMLVIPKRHVVDNFALGQAELNCLHSLMNLLKTSALSDDTSIQGLNISVNCAGITGPNEMHCHVDLVPRRFGDVEKPEGGVRHVTPGKVFYRG